MSYRATKDYALFEKIYNDMQRLDEYNSGKLHWTTSDTVKAPLVAIQTHMLQAFKTLQQRFKSDNSKAYAPKSDHLYLFAQIYEDVVQNLEKLMPVIMELRAILKICEQFNFSEPQLKEKIESEITDLLSSLDSFQRSRLRQEKPRKRTHYDVKRLTNI